MRKGNILRIAVPFMLIWFCIFLTSCESRDARAQRIIDETAVLIPIFSEFYEGNEDFFNLLLDIQYRLKEYYSDGGVIKPFHTQFFLRVGGEDGERQIDQSFSFPSNRMRYTFHSEEIDLIERRMHELDEVLGGEALNVIVRNDWIIVSSPPVMNQIAFRFVSPVMPSYEQFSGRFISYSENFNSDWSFHILTNVRR